MAEGQTLRELCHISSESSDLFVGIRYIQGAPSVFFPHGFRFSDNDKECRKDILSLLSILKRFSDLRDGEGVKIGSKELSAFPIAAYQYIIYDFLRKGYYSEKEIYFTQAARGKIHWKQTIQREKPMMDGENVIYTKFQARNSRVKEHDLLAQIHRYCVYQSFNMLGWLYSLSEDSLEKPLLAFNKDYFLHSLSQALNNTFDDAKRKLFQSMIQIISVWTEGVDGKNLDLGVTHFAPIWEKLVDCIFGTVTKVNDHFPKAIWHLLDCPRPSDSSTLKPDTIMSHGNSCYIIDAKYYKYGITKSLTDLPSTSSIQKQITYGKHIATYPDTVIYNAFIMPFDSEDSVEMMKAIAVSTVSWEKYNKQTENYKYILGVLLDTKWTIQNYQSKNDDAISALSSLIETTLIEFRHSFDKD